MPHASTTELYDESSRIARGSSSELCGQPRVNDAINHKVNAVVGAEVGDRVALGEIQVPDLTWRHRDGRAADAEVDLGIGGDRGVEAKLAISVGQPMITVLIDPRARPKSEEAHGLHGALELRQGIADRWTAPEMFAVVEAIAGRIGIERQRRTDGDPQWHAAPIAFVLPGVEVRLPHAGGQSGCVGGKGRGVEAEGELDGSGNAHWRPASDLSRPTAAKYPSLVAVRGATSIVVRPALDGDRAFLMDVYRASRAEELAVLPWCEEEKAAFVAMQFDAQDRYYANTLPATERSVVLLDGQPIGRMYVDVDDERVLIVDIALLPEHRGHGIGSALLAGVLAEADRRRLPTSLHVEPHSRAQRLYRRLGFSVVEPGAVYDLMVRPWSTSPR